MSNLGNIYYIWWFIPNKEGGYSWTWALVTSLVTFSKPVTYGCFESKQAYPPSMSPENSRLLTHRFDNEDDGNEGDGNVDETSVHYVILPILWPSRVKRVVLFQVVAHASMASWCASAFVCFSSHTRLLSTKHWIWFDFRFRHFYRCLVFCTVLSISCLIS
jgi:hypothetical protein